MKITYQTSSTNIEKENINLPENKCLFTIKVDNPNKSKIFINDIEQDSTIVERMEIVKWKVICEGFKTAIGEFQVLESVTLIIPLEKEEKRKPENPYHKWSINDKYGYKPEVIDLNDHRGLPPKIPSPEGKDNSFLYTVNGYLFWKPVTPEVVFSPKGSDDNKFLKFNCETGFSFEYPLPLAPNMEDTWQLRNHNGQEYWYKVNYDLPCFPEEEHCQKQDYSLNYKNGHLKWKLNQFDLPALPDITYTSDKQYILSYSDNEVKWVVDNSKSYKWGSIKGLLEDQEDLNMEITGLRNKTTKNFTAIVALGTNLYETKKLAKKANSNAESAIQSVKEVEETIEDINSIANKAKAIAKETNDRLCTLQVSVNKAVKVSKDAMDLTVTFKDDIEKIDTDYAQIKEELKDIKSGEIKPLAEAVAQVKEVANEAKDWTDKFNVIAKGLEFVDNTLRYEDGFSFPDGRKFEQMIKELEILRERHATFEYYTKQQLSVRLTSPDYSQIDDVVLDDNNMFRIEGKKYLHIESLSKGDELTVHKALLSPETGEIIGPDLESDPILTLYLNNVNERDVRLIELTVGFYYKVSNPETMKLKLVGELPYGDLP